MLTLTFPAGEKFNENTYQFDYFKEQTITLEHSLISLSKWESKWCKPFLTDEPKTFEETMDYIKCMTVTPNVDPAIYERFTDSQIKEINSYIEAPMTATWFSEKGQGKGKKSKDVITSELIYYWMVALEIPFECQKWHLNRLLTLVRVCNEKNQPPKKMSKSDILNKNKSLNAARRAAMGTKG